MAAPSSQALACWGRAMASACWKEVSAASVGKDLKPALTACRSSNSPWSRYVSASMSPRSRASSAVSASASRTRQRGRRLSRAPAYLSLEQHDRVTPPAAAVASESPHTRIILQRGESMHHLSLQEDGALHTSLYTLRYHEGEWP